MILIVLAGIFLPGIGWAAGNEAAQKDSPEYGLPTDMGSAMARQASQVKQQIQEQAGALFQRQPLGFEWKSVVSLYNWLIRLPLKIPVLLQVVVDQGRTLGVAGSVLVLVFLFFLFYSLFGRRRILRRIEAAVSPLKTHLPARFFPYFIAIFRVLVEVLFPLVLLAIYTLIKMQIVYHAPWFILTGRLILLWTVGAFATSLLRELLTGGLFHTAKTHGVSIYKLSRAAIWYALAGVALVRVAWAFSMRPDVLALCQFVVTVSIIIVLFLLLLKREAILSLIPNLPYPSFKSFINLLQRYYFPLIVFSAAMALLWSLGFRHLGRLILIKLWSSIAAYILIMLIYHAAHYWLNRWYAGIDPVSEAARQLHQAYQRVFIFSTVVAIIIVVLNLLGLLGIMRQILSFPVVTLGQTPVTLWIILKAALILAGFFYLSHLLQAYLDYKVYPAIGVDQGLGYALNTFLKYLMLAIGLLFALNVLGLDLKLLMVFAGAIGIGIGLGMQSIVANVVSGFTLIFGGKLRKGDWIAVQGTTGVVTDIILRATVVRTRDNIEYLIPNSEFITGTLVNYSLGSPLVRVTLPVGVSYSADPRMVERILLAVAKKEPLVSRQQSPGVRFISYGDSSLNFELLFWIDIRKTPIRLVRSELYFAVFEELKKAGIEIPFPQRDLHVRSIAGERPGLEKKISENAAPEG